jgi:hypothetical protein
MVMVSDATNLGDDPPRDRTAELRVLGFPTRHLGSVQMTTDTALGVTKRVVEDRGSSLSPVPAILLPGAAVLYDENTDGFACGQSRSSRFLMSYVRPAPPCAPYRALYYLN